MKTSQRRTFTALRFPIDANTELLQVTLASYLPLGIEEGAKYWTCWFDTEKWNELKENIMEAIQAVAHHSKMEVEEVVDRDWNAVWVASVRPVRISRHAIVAPSWAQVPPSGDQHVIIIDPKMAFGTGHHPTTRLCAVFLERTVSPGCSVLDVGTGTGVLCILAVKLGAARALGLDIDPWAIANAKENITRNGLDQCIEIRDKDIADITDIFDIVVANINRNEIIEIMDTLLSRLKSGGALIISGLVDNDEELVYGILVRKGLRDIETHREDEWVSLLARKY